MLLDCNVPRSSSSLCGECGRILWVSHIPPDPNESALNKTDTRFSTSFLLLFSKLWRCFQTVQSRRSESSINWSEPTETISTLKLLSEKEIFFLSIFFFKYLFSLTHLKKEKLKNTRKL